MDKSSASSQSQRPSAGRREQVTPLTSRPEFMTLPSTQSMDAPNSSTSQPLETSDGRMYLRILRDVSERIKPNGNLSEVFTQLAAQLREEEAPPRSLPLDVPIKSVEPMVAPAVQPLRQLTSEPTAPLTRTNPAERNQIRDKKAEFKEAVESGEAEGSWKEEGKWEEMEGEAQELAEEELEGRTLEAVVVDEGESSGDGETLDARGRQRNLRMVKKVKMVEVEGKLVESATRAVEESQPTEATPITTPTRLT